LFWYDEAARSDYGSGQMATGGLLMTCDRTLCYTIPHATAQAAQRAFPNGNLYLTLHDLIGPIFTNPDFVDLYHV
jgi:hypothetical protein